MKYSILLLAMLLNVNAISQKHKTSLKQHLHLHNEETDSVLDDELDNLMDKYEGNKKDDFKPVPGKAQKAAQQGQGVSAAVEQDMEYKILTGSYTQTASNKAAEDDEMQEILEKYGSESKSEKDRKVLTRENA